MVVNGSLVEHELTSYPFKSYFFFTLQVIHAFLVSEKGQICPLGSKRIQDHLIFSLSVIAGLARSEGIFNTLQSSITEWYNEL